VAGHSQGGSFAIHYGATHPVDGLIPIVPGGNPGSDVFRNKLRKSVKKANKLVKSGKGDE
jgi:pimeloyl-ACP methyl ester carboxylesterase